MKKPRASRVSIPVCDSDGEELFFIEGTVSPGSPAVINAPVERCHEEEPPEWNPEKVVDKKGREIPDAELRALVLRLADSEKAFEAAGEEARDYESAAADHEMDERRDRRLERLMDERDI